MTDPSTQRRALGRVLRALPLVVAVLALVVAAWLGAGLYAGQERVRTAAAWLDVADDWQTLLVATARGLESGDIDHRSEGGFHVPWQADAYTFPIDLPTVEARVATVLGEYPLPLEDHAEARSAFQSSGALLQVTVGRIRLENDVDLRATARAFDRHAADLARLSVPVSHHVAAEAGAIVADAFVLAAVLAFALFVCLVLRPRAGAR